jgi:hypothetical protein
MTHHFGLKIEENILLKLYMTLRKILDQFMTSKSSALKKTKYSLFPNTEQKLKIRLQSGTIFAQNMALLPLGWLICVSKEILKRV